MRTHLVILRGLIFSDIVTLNNIQRIFRISPQKTRLNALVVVEWGSWGGAAEILPSCKLSFSNNGETCAPRKCNACCRSKDYREGIGGWVGGKGEFLSGWNMARVNTKVYHSIPSWSPNSIKGIAWKSAILSQYLHIKIIYLSHYPWESLDYENHNHYQRFTLNTGGSTEEIEVWRR